MVICHFVHKKRSLNFKLTASVALFLSSLLLAIIIYFFSVIIFDYLLTRIRKSHQKKQSDRFWVAKKKNLMRMLNKYTHGALTTGQRKNNRRTTEWANEMSKRRPIEKKIWHCINIDHRGGMKHEKNVHHRNLYRTKKYSIELIFTSLVRLVDIFNSLVFFFFSSLILLSRYLIFKFILSIEVRTFSLMSIATVYSVMKRYFDSKIKTITKNCEWPKEMSTDCTSE